MAATAAVDKVAAVVVIKGLRVSNITQTTQFDTASIYT